MRECAKKCHIASEECKKKDCRLWIDYGSDLNCTLIAAKKNGPMTLREVAERIGVSFVRIKQIEEAALEKLRKRS